MNSNVVEDPLIWSNIPSVISYILGFVKIICTRLAFYAMNVYGFVVFAVRKVHFQWIKVKKSALRLLMFRGSFFYQTPRLGLATVVSTAVFSLIAVPALNPINEHRMVMQVLAAHDTSSDNGSVAGVTTDSTSNGVVMEFDNTFRAAVTSHNDSLNTESTAYVVQGGDTISSIAEEYLVSSEALKYANSLTSDIIKPGQEISIPPVNGLVHTVKDGDTISTIASLYSVSGQTIVDFNFLEEPYIIREGNTLIIPDAKIPQPKPVVYAAAPQSQPAGLSLQSIAPSASGTGGFGMPTSGTFTHYFWWGHTAVDIANSCGTPIVAADSGTITFAGWWAGGGGNSIFIDHGNGYVTKYAHMNGFALTGGGVSKGQVIGYMGDTGRAYGCHLHFIVNYGAQATDPMSIL